MAYWSHRQLHNNAWDYFLNTIDADFYLVQESVKPIQLENENNFIWHNAGDTAGRRDWGNGIYSKKYKLNQEPVESIQSWNKQTFDEMCVVANSRINTDVALTIINIYGRMDKVGSEKYSIANLHRVLSDLTGIFNGHYGKRNIILGGDFNASTQFDIKQNNNSHKIYFDRLEDFGLKNSFDLNGNTEYVQTHRHNISKLNWQNDYLFFSKQTAKGFVDCEVIDNEEVRRLSDHNPVIVTLDI